MKKISLLKLHKLYIQGTEEKAPVVLQTVLLCNTTNAAMKAVNLTSPKIHITTKMLKHLYDSKPAEDFKYLSSLETTVITSLERTIEEMNFAVTAFRIRKESYLQNYKLLWSWKGDIPSS